MSQTLHAELQGTGVNVHVVCPGIVATEFHEVQGMDLSAIPRMSAEDVVTATLSGIALGEVGVSTSSFVAQYSDTVPDTPPRHRESLRTGPTGHSVRGLTSANADCSKSVAPSRVTIVIQDNVRRPSRN